jgi:diguanylate cyclase (GGDEF)-like protein
LKRVSIVPHDEWGKLWAEIAAAPAPGDAAHALSRGLARLLERPLALLSHDGTSWHFEGGGVPDGLWPALSTRLPGLPASPAGTCDLSDATGQSWTGIVVGRVRGREWVLMAPGKSEAWRELAGLEPFVDQIGSSLEYMAERDEQAYLRRFNRRLFALSRRLARDTDHARVHQLILRTMAAQAAARTGVLATYVQAEDALAISATHGYPRAIVEHIRIPSGEGILGRAFASGRPVLGRSSDDPERAPRLRYRTDSYMVVPVVAGARRVAIIALTDRSDGRAFDSRDFASARILAANAALAFTREQLTENLMELTKIATVDAVTGLFNRRYFESRLEAEVQRARRQRQDLALLMIDIDDFKRINDIWGHLEGDRALRDVADLLRTGVRIFDVCARFGGEEFVIVMPGATAQIAMHVAERIRRQVEQHSAHDSQPITVSIGVGMLDTHASVDDLLLAADRALIAAKTAGKNLVWLDDPVQKGRRETDAL